MGERNDLIERLLNPLWAHMRGGEPHLDDEATLADLKEAAATIARLSEALAEAEKKGAEDKQRFDWLEVNRNMEISHESFEDDVWQVHAVNGNRSDLEWTKRAEADTVREAIDAAIRSAPPRDLSQGGQHG